MENTTNVLHPGSAFREEVKGLIHDFDFGNCLSCGMCTAGCPFSDLVSGLDPRRFVRKLLLGLREEVLSDPFVFLCNMCERCTIECPMGIKMGALVRTVRGHFYTREQYPGFLQKVVQEQLETGNQMSVTPEEFLETLDWLQEELQQELGDPDYRIPLDRRDADYFYAFNAREVKYYPHELQAVLKIFYAAGINYTISSRKWDATNLALFTGNNEDFYKIQMPLFEEVVRLGAKELIITECGGAFYATRHAYRTYWKGRPFQVRHIIQLLDQLIGEGRLKLDPTVITVPVTYHDPCSLARKEGLAEEARRVLKAFIRDFREMNPNRKVNYCCGGGGGFIAMPEYSKIRIEAKGQRKAEQIRATGAQIVAVPCHNCMDQINDVTLHFKLGTSNRHICSLVEEALIMPPRKKGNIS